jgi:hypothetical protein
MAETAPPDRSKTTGPISAELARATFNLTASIVVLIAAFLVKWWLL